MFLWYEETITTQLKTRPYNSIEQHKFVCSPGKQSTQSKKRVVFSWSWEYFRGLNVSDSTFVYKKMSCASLHVNHAHSIRFISAVAAVHANFLHTDPSASESTTFVIANSDLQLLCIDHFVCKKTTTFPSLIPRYSFSCTLSPRRTIQLHSCAHSYHWPYITSSVHRSVQMKMPFFLQQTYH